jgi:uncharacterized protein (TIGR02145 family)
MKNIFIISGVILLFLIIHSCVENTNLPVLTTATVSAITQTTATSGGNVIDEGGAPLVSRGICWHTSANPTIENNKTVVASGAGAFTSDLTQLAPNTLYYVRAYASNTAGTGYGNQLSFSTSQTISLPIVTTIAATVVTQTGATLNGTVNANNLSTTVTFDYGTTTSYGQSINATPNTVSGNTTTNVSASLTGLIVNTLYHFRVKVVSTGGTTYGSDMTFTPGQGSTAPTVTTTAATSVAQTGATLNGTVNANNLSTTVTFEYGTTTSYGQSINAAPNTVSGNTTTNVSANLTGLIANTLYHYRVKVLSNGITTNGNDLTFTTLSSGGQTGTVTDIDGNVYNTVTIGTQVWMAENLKTTKYNDGTAIPNITDNSAWSLLTTGAYSDYSNIPANSTTYGRLYNWYVGASSNPKNVCPTGWHVPTDAQWYTLITYLGGEAVAGSKLKETGTTHWTPTNTGATNETGFTALPGGCRNSWSGTFVEIGSIGFWWSSTETTTNGTDAYSRAMANIYSTVGRSNNGKKSGFSYRCLKD